MGAANILLIPKTELAAGQAGAIRNEAIKRVLTLAMTQLKLAEDKLVVRDIRPKADLDYTYEGWRETTGSTAGAYETMTTGTMGEQRYVGIYGVKINADSLSCSMLKFNTGGGDRTFWSLEHLNEEDGYVGFSPFGIIIPQNAPYTISRYVMYASAAAPIVLKGFVVEPRGRVITP